MKDYGHESFRDKNHSKKFWKEMNKLVGDGKRLRRKMRGCRIGVYLGVFIFFDSLLMLDT